MDIQPKRDEIVIPNSIWNPDRVVITDNAIMLEIIWADTRRTSMHGEAWIIEPNGLLFEKNHFQIEEYYSDVAGKPYHSDSTEMAIVARKAVS